MKYIIVLIVVVLVIGAAYYGVAQVLNLLGNVFYTPQYRAEEVAVYVYEQEYVTPAPKQLPITRDEPEEPPRVISSRRPSVTPPSGFTVDEISPYYGAVTISSVRSSYSLQYPRIFSLRAGYSVGEGISISGWRVRNNKNNEIVIPQGVNLYDPLRIQGQSDIVLDSNHTVQVYFSKSPLGRNVRLNKCIGYLNNIYEFNPPFPKSCPSIDRKEIVSFSGECQSLALSLGRCEEPSNKKLSTFFEPSDLACRAFLGKINYRGCYDRYLQDADFLTREWRVWLDKIFLLDPRHDRLLLFDTQGLLVDEYVY